MIGPFKGKYRYLSNFYKCDILYQGMLYVTAEHAYQAAKTLDPQQRQIIVTCATPGDAKRSGRALNLREDWEDVKLRIMKEVIRAKFSQHELLKDRLVLTEKEEIVEVNYWGDTFWGVCKGKGENHLGRILMQVREELAS